MKASTSETIVLIITLTFYLLVLITPVIVGKKLKNNSYLALLFLSIVSTFVLSTFSVYWSEDLSAELIYEFYGFDPDGMNELERWPGEMASDDKKTIERIYNRSFGIGWPVKLIGFYVIFMIPYNLVVCGIIRAFKKQALATSHNRPADHHGA